jgi:hypothetical protein
MAIHLCSSHYVQVFDGPLKGRAWTVPVYCTTVRTLVYFCEVVSLFHFKSNVQCRLVARSGNSNRAWVVRYWV